MKPLDGVKVVEFATHVVVPVAARILSDWGAQVIKVEALTGDKWRLEGLNQNLPADEGANLLYAIPNSGKKMVALNLKQPEGREALLRLLEDADVFCTNVRWAAIQRLGLDYESLHKRFPRLVYMHFTGFGYEGPEAARPGFDLAGFWAMSGAMADAPELGARPMMTPSAFGDMITSGSALSGILAALYHQAKTGDGMRLTTSLYANGIWCNFAQIIATQKGWEGIKLPRRAEDTPNPLGGVYQCGDGRWLLLAADYGFQFESCMRVLGLSEFVKDPRFMTYGEMKKNHLALFRAMEERFLTKSADEWSELLCQADIVYQKLVHSSEVSESEQAWANGYLTRVKFPNGMEAIEPNSPVQFFGCDIPETRAAGYIGADTSAMLREYGYSQAEIDRLKEKGVAGGT